MRTEVCVACRTRCGDDRVLCLLLQDRHRAMNECDAFSDGAIFGALMAGMELDAYEELLDRRADAARRAVTEYVAAQNLGVK